MEPIFRRILTDFYHSDINGATYRHEYDFIRGDQLRLKVFLSPSPTIRLVFEFYDIGCMICYEQRSNPNERFDLISATHVYLPCTIAEAIISNPVFPTRRSLNEILEDHFTPIDIWTLDGLYDHLKQDFPPIM